MASPWHRTSTNIEQVDLDKLEIKDLLILILLELKTMNRHLYSMTDEEGV
jgi:hypothetical protein